MSGNFDFFGESLEQSQVKTAIVSKYFWAWAKIIMNKTRENRIAYIDLFAGPGRYKDGTKSTPLLVLEQAIADPKMSQMLVTMFNDKDEDNSQSLERAISELPNIKSLKHKPNVYNQEVGTELVKMFAEMHLVPTLFFVDPWGYKGLSLQLVNAVVKDWACECIFFFNYNRVSMGLNNSIVTPHMNALFGENTAEELRERLEGVSSDDRERAIIEALCKALNPNGGRFVLPFRFRNARGTRTSHHLIFVSKSFLGYDIMKGIMAKESTNHDQGVPSFEYNPADSRFPLLFELSRPLDDLEGMLFDAYANKTLSFEELYRSHSVGRRYIGKNYKEVLIRLADTGKITAAKPDGKPRRKNTFADDVVVTFPAKGK